MKSTEISDRVLVALLTLSRKSGFTYYAFQTIADEAGVTLPPGFDELLLQQFGKSDLVDLSDDEYSEPTRVDGNDVPYVRLNWQGIQAAELLFDQHPEYGGSAVPTSHGYVSPSHNQIEVVEADLRELAENIRGNNDFEAEDERLIALSEIASFERTIAQPRVSTDLIQRFVDTILGWITRRFSSAMVAEIAQRLVQALVKLMG